MNDGSFHAVELVASDQSLSLSIDGGTPKSMSSLSKQSILNIDSPLYLGGKHTNTLSVFVFVGVCVRALYSSAAVNSSHVEITDLQVDFSANYPVLLTGKVPHRC